MLPQLEQKLKIYLGDYPTTPVSFRTKYLEMIQRNPDVVLFHANIKKITLNLPAHDATKMIDLLNVRQHWSAGSKLRLFRPGNKKPS